MTVKEGSMQQKGTKAGKGLVFFLDANIGMTNTYIDFLGRRGYEVEAMSDPDKALDFIGEHSPKIIFFNYLANPMGAERFFREAKKLSPQSVFILHTGYHQHLIHDKMTDLGVERIIYKPASLRLILATIQEYVF